MRRDFMQKFEAPIQNLEGKLAGFGSTLKVDRKKLFAEPEYFVTIVGEFSSGKSSILNRLFFGEKDAIPTAVLPETCLINEIRYGNSMSVALVSGGVEKDIDVSAISEVSKKELIEQKNDSMIKMECNDELLSDKVVFVDTPGVNSINDSHTDITFGYLPKSQFVLFVVDINHGGLTRSEIEFIKNKVFTVTQNNMFILINKSDCMISSDCEQIREQIVKDLANTGIRPERVCLVSGLKGTGIAELKATLKRELDAKRAEYYKNYTQSVIASFADLAIAELKLKLENIKKDTATFAADKAAMEKEVKSVKEKYRELDAQLEQKLNKLFEFYEIKIGQDFSEIANAICAKIKGVPLSKISGKDISEGIQVNLKKYMEDNFQPKFDKDMQKLLKEITADTESVLYGLGKDVKPDLTAPGKAISIALYAIELVIYNLVLPMGWIVAILGQRLGRTIFGKLTDLMEVPVKSIICNNVKKAFDNDIIPPFVEEFKSKKEDVKSAIAKGIEDSINSQISVVENGYSDRNIEMLKAHDSAKADIEAAIKDAEALKALAVN